MAKHLDLEEQEQLDQIKHFWAQYGNAITWLLIAVLGGFAAWNGWNYWQNRQAIQAAALFDEVQAAAQANDAERLKRSLVDMRTGFAKTAFAAQSSLLAARSIQEAGDAAAAREALQWIVDNNKEPAYLAVARLRLAALDLAAGDHDKALSWLSVPMPPAYEALAADRRGDVLLAQGKADEASTQYQSAWRSLSDQVEYRRLVEVKLASLGVDVTELVPVEGVAK